IHTCMPVLLQRQTEHAWLASETPLRALLACLRPYPAALLRAYQVSTLVNSAAVDEPELITPERSWEQAEKPGSPQVKAPAPVSTAPGSASQRSAAGICTVSYSAEEEEREETRGVREEEEDEHAAECCGGRGGRFALRLTRVVLVLSAYPPATAHDQEV